MAQKKATVPVVAVDDLVGELLTGPDLDISLMIGIYSLLSFYGRSGGMLWFSLKNLLMRVVSLLGAFGNVDGAYSAGTSRAAGALHTTLVAAISMKRAVGCA